MKRCLICVATLGLVLAIATVDPEAQGRQGRGGGRGFSNLQVFPSDIPAPQLVQAMLAFETALGVDCSYCHIFNGRGAPGNDLASDEKAPKEVARTMLRMLRGVNQTLADEIDKPIDELTRVRCITCHRGQVIPQTDETGSGD
jgi:hypothetical protein